MQSSRSAFNTPVDPISPPSKIHRVFGETYYTIFVPTMETDVSMVEAAGTAPASSMSILLSSSTTAYIIYTTF